MIITIVIIIHKTFIYIKVIELLQCYISVGTHNYVKHRSNLTSQNAV